MSELIDVAEMKTMFTGDLSAFEAAATRAKQIASETAAAMSAAMAGGLGGGASGAGAAAVTQNTQAMVAALNQVAPAATQASVSVANLAAQKAILAAELKEVQSQLRTEAQALVNLQQAAGQYGSTQASLNAQLQQAQAAVGELAAKQVQLQQALKQANDALKQQQQSMTQAQTATISLRSAVQDLSQGMLMGGIALAGVGAGFGALIKSGAELQTALAHVAGNTSMSTEEFNNLQASTVRLGLTVPVAMDDIGKSYMQAANFGFHFAEANQVVEAALKSAVATGASAEQTTRALAVAMHLFNIPASEAAQTMDILHLAAARGGQTLEQFTSVTGKLFSVAHSMGVSLIDASAAMSALTSAGLPAAQAATLLQGAIVKIVNPAQNAQKEIARLSQVTGIDLVKDFSQAGVASKGLSGVIADISKAVGGNTAEIFKLVPAMRGGIGVIILATGAAKDYKDRLQELNDVQAGKLKPTLQDFERVMQTLGAQTTILGNSFQALGFELVSALGPSLVGGLQTLNGVLPTAVLFIGQLPPVILAAAAAFVVAVGVVGTVSVALGALALLLGGPVAIAIAGLGIAVGLMAAVVALNFSAVTAVISQGGGNIKISFIQMAGVAGSLADAFQILARAAVFAFDIIVTGARLMAEGVKLAFTALDGVAVAVSALLTGDIVGFGAAVKQIGTVAFENVKAIGQTIKGLAQRSAADIADISHHASGQFAAQFTLAAMNAGKAFADASAKQHQLVEDAGLKLVNAYMSGVHKGHQISQAEWHSMSDEARASFLKTADAWIQNSVRLLDGLNDVTSRAGGKTKAAAEEAAKALAEVQKEQLAGVNDYLKAIDSKTQISERVWNKLLAPDTKAALVRASDAFHAVQDVIQTGQAQWLADLIKNQADQKVVLDVSSADYERWGAKIEQAAKEHGAAINVVFLHLPDNIELMSLAMKANSVENKKILDDIAFAHGVAAAKIKMSWDDLARDFPINKLRAALKEVKDMFAGNVEFGEMKVAQAIQREWDGAIRILEEEGQRLGKTQDEITANIVAKLGRMSEGMSAEAQRGAELAVINYKRGLDKLPGALDDVFNKLALGAKRQVSGLIEVLNNIPGAFGDVLRKSTSTIVSWISQIDSLFKGLHKIFDAIPDGLTGVIASIIGMFKGVSTAATEVSKDVGQGAEDWVSDLGKMNQASGAWSENASTQMNGVVGVLQGAAAKGLMAIGGMVAGIGMMLSGHATGGALGIIEGALGGALTGAMIGGYWAFATGGLSVLIGAAIGGLIGALGGIFGGGKTAAQKAQEAQAAEQAKLNMQQAAQSVINAAIDGFDAALKFFDQLDDFTTPRKKKFAEFFKALTLLMNYFVELSKTWGTASLAEAKALGEALGPIMTAISSGLDAFEKLSNMTTVPKRAIAAFVTAMTDIIQAFADAATKIGDDAISAAKRLSKRIAATIDLIGTGVTAFTALAAFPGVPQSQAKLFADGMTVAINELGKVLDVLDKNALPSAKSLSKRAGEIVSLIGSGVTALTSLASFGGLTQAAVDLFRDGMVSAIKALIDVAGQIDTELLVSAQKFSDRAGSTITLIGTAIQSFKDLALIKAVPIEAFNNLGAMIKQAVSVLVVIAGEISEEGASAAASFAAKAGPVVSTIKEAVDAFNTLNTLQNVEGGPFVALRIYIGRAIRDLGQLAGELSDDLISKAAAFGNKIKGVFDAIGSAVNVFTGLSNLSGGPSVAGSNFPDMGQALDFILNGIRSGVDSIIKIAGDVSGEGIAAAVVFSEKAKLIFEAVVSGATAFKAIAEIPPLSVSAWDLFFDNIVRMIDRIAAIVGLMTPLLEGAQQFGSMAAEIQTLLADGSASLSDGLSGISSTSLGASSAPSPALGSGASASTLTAASHSSSSTVTINVTQEAPPASALGSESDYSTWMRNWWRQRAAFAQAAGDPPIPEYMYA